MDISKQQLSISAANVATATTYHLSQGRCFLSQSSHRSHYETDESRPRIWAVRSRSSRPLRPPSHFARSLHSSYSWRFERIWHGPHWEPTGTSALRRHRRMDSDSQVGSEGVYWVRGGARLWLGVARLARGQHVSIRISHNLSLTIQDSNQVIRHSVSDKLWIQEAKTSS